MKYLLTAVITLLFCNMRFAYADLPLTETAIIEPPVGFTISHAQAADDAPFAALSDGGSEFWLFDATKRSFKSIAKNIIGDWDHQLHHTQWASSRLVLFRNWEGLIEILNPDLSIYASFPADLKSAPLRMSYWIDDYSMLVDETDFYRNSRGTLSKIEKSSPFAHTVQTGLLVLDNQRLITSGFHDQTVKVWSLPDGNLLHDWNIGSWYSKRQITAIALSHNRLLIATNTGHLEERSLTNGEKLWAARPCRDPVNFHYSSIFGRSLSINVNDSLFFNCGSHIGHIEPQQKGWLISSFNEPLKGTVAQHHALESANGSHKVTNELLAVETITGSELAILIFADGSSVAVNKKQKRVLQKLANVKHGTAPVTYMAAAKQLFLADSKGRVHLYQIGKKTSD